MQIHTTICTAILLAFTSTTWAVPPSPEPQSQEVLPQIFEIQWSAAPPMPQGMQDNDGGVIDNFLVMAVGFCHGQGNEQKPGVYPRGFLKKTWALNLDNEAEGWIDLSDFPGAARQETVGMSVNNEIYLWGGFSYTDPFCYSDGYKLSHRDGQWQWSPLPDLLRPVSVGSVTAVGSKIYLIGGMDYDAREYYVSTDRTGEVKRFGARIYVFDTASPDDGWSELTPCPGTPRMMSAVASFDQQIYVIGGYAVDENGGRHSVVDSWRYDPQADTWHRLRDLPVAVAGFSTGTIAYRDRYILLATGYPQPTIMDSDGTIRPSYGEPSKIDRSKWPGEGLNGSIYENHVWVYDTKRNLYGTATYLPFDDHAQTVHIIGDTMYMFPGETGGFYWEDEFFGHAPEFVLKGKIRVLDWE